jgi:hypothetical protein
MISLSLPPATSILSQALHQLKHKGHPSLLHIFFHYYLDLCSKNTQPRARMFEFLQEFIYDVYLDINTGEIVDGNTTAGVAS